ncbi:MAG: hypothetical protein Q4E73_00030 [Lachnospiraceae bacterium]|nr:hypothetical protein [Lachnospiraceae bacterium]
MRDDKQKWDALKKEYESIEIPDGLEARLQNRIDAAREEKQKDRKYRWKKAISMAACFVCVLFMGNVVSYSATGNYLHELIQKSIVTNFYQSGGQSEVEEEIDQNSVCMAEENVIYKDFKISLYKCFSEKATGNILMQFCVTDLEGNQLNEDERNKVEDMMSKGELSFDIPDLTGGMSVFDYVDKEKRMLIDVHYMLPLSKEDRTSLIDSVKKIKLMDASCKEQKEIGTFLIPENSTEFKSAKFCISDGKKSLEIVVSGIGIQAFSDTEQGENKRSNSWWEFYIYMKDGTRYLIEKEGLEDFKDSENLVAYDTIIDDEKLADRVIGFSKVIDVEQIDYLKIDGVKYGPTR